MAESHFGEGPQIKRFRSEADPPSRGISFSGTTLQLHDISKSYKYEYHEALPQLPSNHPDMATVQRLCEQGVQDILNGITKSKGLDDEIRGLCKELESKMVPNLGSRITIGVVGDTGAGKSTFINTLLGKTGLAAMGDGGDSCTQVVQDFVDDPQMGANYEAVIRFKHQAVIRDDIKRHFQKYFRHNNVDDLEDEEARNCELEDEAKTAEGYFLALFANLTGFADESVLSETMLAASSPHDETFIEQKLLRNFDRLWRSLDVDEKDRALTLSANTLSDLENQLKRFTETIGGVGVIDKQASLWPIVDTVRSSLDSPLLRQGFSIGDCPGLSDTNEDRRQRSLQFLDINCHAIIVVAPIDRANSSPSVLRYLKRYLSAKGVSNVFVVLTKTDVIQQNPPGCGPSKEKEMQILKKDYDAAQQAADDLELSAWSSDEQRIAWENAKCVASESYSRLERCRIIARNEVVMAKMRSALKKHTGGSTLQVVPISSAIHQKYMRGISRSQFPSLDLAEDGFAEIRRLLCERASHGRAAALDRHVFHVVTSGINRLNLALQKSRLERKGVVLAMLQEPIDTCDDNILDHTQDINKLFRGLSQDFKAAIGSVWSSNVQGKVDEFGRRFYAVTFTAFCRRNGVHRCKRMKTSESMNEHLLELVRNDVYEMTHDMTDEVRKQLPLIDVETRRLFHQVEHSLRCVNEIGGIDMTLFWAQFKLRTESFHDSLNLCFDALQTRLRDAVTRATTDTDDTAFAEAMAAIYAGCLKKANFTRKTKMYEQRRKYFFQQITSTTAKGPFMALALEITTRFNDEVKHWREDVTEIVRAPFNGIRSDLDLRFGGEQMSDEERGVLRDALRKVMVPIDRLFNVEIREAMDRVHAWGAPKFDARD